MKNAKGAAAAQEAAKHTPGPWRVREINTGFGIDRTIVGPDGAPIDDNSKANARLIAAAPDLLEALYELTSAAQYCRENGGDVLTSCSWHKADRAITKATGEEK